MSLVEGGSSMFLQIEAEHGAKLSAWGEGTTGPDTVQPAYGGSNAMGSGPEPFPTPVLMLQGTRGSLTRVRKKLPPSPGTLGSLCFSPALSGR